MPRTRTPTWVTKQRISEIQSAERGDRVDAIGVPRALPMLITGIIAAATSANSAIAGTTFTEAATKKLLNICTPAETGTKTYTIGANLLERCNQDIAENSNGGISGSAPGSAAVGAPLAPIAIQRRLDKIKKQRNGKTTSSLAAASADSTLALGEGVNVFVVPGYERFNKSNNRYEDGYRSNIGRLTLGGDYQVSRQLVGGLALTYSYDDGKYDDGQGFDNQAFGVSIFSSYLPFDGAFVDFTAGYTYLRYDGNRVARLFDDANPPGIGFQGTIGAEHNAHGFNGGFLAGYDVPFGSVTIGPRLGFSAAYIGYDDYRESGNTGLELRYNSDSETSLQSRVGAAASMAVSTSFGVLLPQIEAAWVHEFADDQRSIKAEYREARGSGNFRYDTESPDRNFGIIGVGLTAVLPNGLQPFTAFRTIVGNDNYNSYAVSVGLRLEL